MQDTGSGLIWRNAPDFQELCIRSGSTCQSASMPEPLFFFS